MCIFRDVPTLVGGGWYYTNLHKYLRPNYQVVKEANLCAELIALKSLGKSLLTYMYMYITYAL